MVKALIDSKFFSIRLKSVDSQVAGLKGGAIEAIVKPMNNCIDNSEL